MPKDSGTAATVLELYASCYAALAAEAVRCREEGRFEITPDWIEKGDFLARMFARAAVRRRLQES